MPSVAKVLLLVAFLLALVATTATAATTSVKLYACVTPSFKTLNLTTAKAKCPNGQTKVSWNVEGPKGPAGPKGGSGAPGAPGTKGDKGDPSTPGGKGDAGAKGDPGAAGANGANGANGADGATGADGTPADLSLYQLRVTGVCGPGSWLDSVGADGTVGCSSPTLPLTLTDPAPNATGLGVSLPDPGSGNAAISASVGGSGNAVFGESASGVAVRGLAHSISAAGVIGNNARGEVVVGIGGSGCTDAPLSNCAGIGAVVGRNDGPGGYGVRGFTTAGGATYHGIGVLGQAGVSGSNGTGVRGENVNAANGDNAVEAVTNGTGSALFAQGTQAGTFNGAVTINGDLTVTGTKSGFHIDDPRAPTVRTLTHTPVETDQLTVVYTGNVRTDAHGRATVKLPAYATTIAGDWRYQLTPIGGFGQVIVAREVRDGAFVVRSEHPRMKVSWSITGVRHDPQSRQAPIVAVQDKTGADRGHYLDPKAYGKPASDGVAGVKPLGSASTTAQAASTKGRGGLPSSR
jgi:hypothetical protein